MSRFYCFAECHYAECHYAECRGTKTAKLKAYLHVRFQRPISRKSSPFLRTKLSLLILNSDTRVNEPLNLKTLLKQILGYLLLTFMLHYFYHFLSFKGVSLQRRQLQQPVVLQAVPAVRRRREREGPFGAGAFANHGGH
jgi:hypothetical protein